MADKIQLDDTEDHNINNNSNNIIKNVAIALPIGLFSWEYLAIKLSSNLKPSIGMNLMADNLKKTFKLIGVYFAKLSSFYTYINFDDIKKAFIDIFKPIIEICGSPYKIISGYHSIMNIAYRPYLIGFGSLTIISGILFSLHKYFALYPEKYISLKDTFDKYSNALYKYNGYLNFVCF